MLKKRLYKIFAVSVFFCVAITELRSQPALDFRHLAVEDGLSNGSVLSITQDANGFIWIGTMDGLNRYDGKRVKIYKSFYKDNPAGGGMKITQLVADQYQRLWIGTDNGLYCYDSKIDSFRYFSHKGNSIEGLSNNSVKALYLDRSNYLWIGTENGLDKIKLGPRDDDYKVAHVSLVENGPAFLSHNIQAIFETADGGYWIGTQNGLLILGEKPKNKYAVARKVFSSMPVSSFAEDRGHNIWIGSSANGVYRLNRQTGHIDSFTHADGIISNVIRKIHVDKQGNVWAGSLKGLMLYNPASRSFRSFVHKPEDNRTLTYNSVYALYEDAQGNIWVGTYFGGANIAEAISTPFTVYKNEENKNSVSSNVISSIVSDSLDNLWIGTEAEGLNYYDRKKDLFYHFKNEENNPHSLSSDLVKMILKDKEDRIWVGLNNGILDELSTDKKQFRHYTIYGGGGASTGDGIVSLAEDGRNNIWVWKITTGLYIMNKKEGRARAFQEFFPDKNLSNPGLTYLFADSRKCVWIGTRKGLNVMDSSQTQIRAYFAKDGLQSDYINCIAEDKSGIIWIGTYSGISYYDYRHHSLRTLDTKGFLSGRRLVGIVTDNENNLWASTNNGLIRIDSTRTVFTSYDKFDGLPGDVFNNNSFSKDNAGRLYFGGYNGFVAFDPALIKMNKMTPGIILTGLSVNNANVRPRDGSDILFGDIVATKEIQLAYNQNIIKINYAVLNYIKPLKNKSAYMLAGFDRDWTITQQQEAAYTNLPPGTYKLFLKGANNDGVWSAPRLYLTIVVHPPFWRTWWAYLIYVLLFLAALYGAFRFFLSREKFKRDFQYEHMLNVKQTELHQMKMDFFTHISHEIRTPLTMIVGPADMLMEQDLPPHVGKKLLSSIKSNAERLLKLTNDLLDFRKADDGYMRLRLQHTDLVGFSKKVFEKFAGKALQQSVNYTFETKEEKMAAWFDPGQIEIVIANLLSNALKFTNEYGVVKMIMEKNRDYAFINVMDNGAGIPVDDQGKIFTHFYQAAAGDDSKTGSGIGLAFSKKLMELHGGDLSFTSKTHETRFVITIPLGKWYLHTTNKYVTTI